MLRFTLRHAYAILAVVSVLVVLSITSIVWMGGEFLPPFNEGTLTINVQTEPGTSLDESNRVARRVEKLLLEVPEVLSVSRRTGRAELDEHAEGSTRRRSTCGCCRTNGPSRAWASRPLRLIPGRAPLGRRASGPAARRGAGRHPRQGHQRPRREGQHRPADLAPARPHHVGRPGADRRQGVRPGPARTADRRPGQSRSGWPRFPASSICRSSRRSRSRRCGCGSSAKRRPATAWPRATSPSCWKRPTRAGRSRRCSTRTATSTWSSGSTKRRGSDPDEIGKTILDTPSGRKVALGEVAEVLDTTGPNTLNRENVQRRIVVFCNVQGRDLAGVVARHPAANRARSRSRCDSFRATTGSNWAASSRPSSRRTSGWLCWARSPSIGVFLLLCKALQSWGAALQVLVNIPLAAIGSVIALLLTNWPEWDALRAAPWWQWPRVWVEATSLSVAHWVGFITLIGIVSRNGIMMISHYIHLMKHEGEQFGEKMIIRGSLERLAPVMMTAMTSFIGLLPLLFGAGQTGKEILYPLAVVVFGGMLASTILDQIVTPALFFKFGGRVFDHATSAESLDHGIERMAEELFPAESNRQSQRSEGAIPAISPRDSASVEEPNGNGASREHARSAPAQEDADDKRRCNETSDLHD